MTQQETKEQKAEHFRQMCIDILAQSGNCADSQRAFGSAQTIAQVCKAWHTYWHGMLTEVPQQVSAAFQEFYPDFKDELNAAGYYYNEDTPNGIVIVAGEASDKPITLSRTHNAYIIGPAHVVLQGTASAIAMHPDCIVELHGSSRATVKEGYAIAAGTSWLTTHSDAECRERSTVHIAAGTLTDHGHRCIHAYSNAAVRSFTNQNINIHDNATLTIENNTL